MTEQLKAELSVYLQNAQKKELYIASQELLGHAVSEHHFFVSVIRCRTLRLFIML